MTSSPVFPDQEGDGRDFQAVITVDPVSFFDYASAGEDRWRELIGLAIDHCTFGPGTIKKVEGEYLYVDLPQRQGRKQLTEFGLEALRRGFFSNLQINNSLQERILAAAAARVALAAQPDVEAAAPKKPEKKRKKAVKTTKTAKKTA